MTEEKPKTIEKSKPCVGLKAVGGILPLSVKYYYYAILYCVNILWILLFSFHKNLCRLVFINLVNNIICEV